MMDKFIKFFSNLSLKTKILISYLICILLPLPVLGGFLYRAGIERITNQSCAVAQQAVKQYNKIFDEYIRQVDAITLLPYINKDLQNYLLKNTDYHTYMNKIVNREVIYSFLESQFQVNMWIDCISIVSLNGQILSQSKYGRVKAEYSVLDNSFYSDFFTSTGEITLSQVHRPSYMFAPTNYVFTAGRKILDFREGFYSGYILVDCSTDIFKRACEKVTLGKKEYILITDKYGNLLYSSRNPNAADDQIILDTIKDGEREKPLHKIQGEKVIVASDKSNLTEWIVYSIQPYSMILDAVQPVKNTFNNLIAISSILGIFFSVVISRSVTGPLFRLQDTIKKIQQGNTKLRANVENTSEVGQLSLTFNQLLDKTEYLVTSLKSIELKRKEAQLEALMSKINPHFLYNTLDSIRMMAVTEGKKDIARAIEALAGLFRYTIRLKKDIIDIKTEIEYIEDYVLLQKIRYEDDLNVIYDIDPSLLNHKIIKLTLQPLVENAIKHGIDRKSGVGEIRISVYSTDGNLIVTVTDDGEGMSFDGLQKIRNNLSKDYAGDHMGLKNIQERIQLYFGPEYGLQVESKHGEGTTVTVKIPDYQDEEQVMKNAVSVSGG